MANPLFLEVTNQTVRYQFWRRYLRIFASLRLLLALIAYQFVNYNHLYHLAPPLDPEVKNLWMLYLTLAVLFWIMLWRASIFRHLPIGKEYADGGYTLIRPWIIFSITMDLVFVTTILLGPYPYQNWAKILFLIPLLQGGILLMSARSVSFLTSLIVIIVLARGFWEYWQFNSESILLESAVYSIIYILTGIFFAVLVRKQMRESQTAEFRLHQLRQKEALLSLVLQDPSRGVMLLSSDGLVETANQAAIQYLHLPKDILNVQSVALRSFAHLQPLHKFFTEWSQKPDNTPKVLQLSGKPLQIQLIKEDKASGKTRTTDRVLAYIDSWAAATHAAQDDKLKSMGRLVAAVAHEIRNPLAAISHAGEMMIESTQAVPLHSTDSPSSQLSPATQQKLAQIIVDQSSRINRMIEDILTLGKRPLTHRGQVDTGDQTIDLNAVIPKIILHWTETRQISPQLITFISTEHSAHVLFIQSQLQQILDNLLDNAYRYCLKKKDSITLLLVNDDGLCLWIANDGDHVIPIHHERLFEPFFTTESKGSGLGLFISREIALANHAQIRYIDLTQGIVKLPPAVLHCVTAFVIRFLTVESS